MDALLFAFGLSLTANVALGVLLYRRRITPQKLDLTAQDLLHDLMRRGTAVVRVEVVDPSALLLRSPRL